MALQLTIVFRNVVISSGFKGTSHVTQVNHIIIMKYMTLHEKEKDQKYILGWGR